MILQSENAPGLFNKETGEIISNPLKIFTKIPRCFWRNYYRTNQQNKNIVGVTPAMLSGSSLNKMLDVQIGYLMLVL